MIRKKRLISNFVTSQLGEQSVLKHILPNISRSKRQSENEICSVSSILLTEEISLSNCLLLLEILGNICFRTDCSPACDVTKFEINLFFLIKSFYYITKKSRQKFNHLENERSFLGEIKSIFYHC